MYAFMVFGIFLSFFFLFRCFVRLNDKTRRERNGVYKGERAMVRVGSSSSVFVVGAPLNFLTRYLGHSKLRIESHICP